MYIQQQHYHKHYSSIIELEKGEKKIFGLGMREKRRMRRHFLEREKRRKMLVVEAQ